MRIKTISAENIADAKERASFLFGNRFVVLESADAKSGLPAYIKVALDDEAGYRDSALPEKDSRKPVHLLQPLMKQVEDLMEKGSKTISAFKNENGGGEPEESGQDKGRFNEKPSAGQSGKREGVYFEKSKNFEAYLNQNKLSSNKSENPEKRNSRINNKEGAGREKRFVTTKSGSHRIDDIHRRIGRLEEYTRLISANLIPALTGHPCYDLLQTRNFREQDIIEITNHLPESGLNPEQVRKILIRYLETMLNPRNPGIDNKTMLFITAYEGIDPLTLVSEVIRHNANFENDNLNRPAIISIGGMAVPENHFLNNFEVLSAGNKTEIANICRKRTGKQPLFIVTNPLPFDLESTAERLYGYEVMFSEMEEMPEYHLVIHPMFEAEQLARYAPSNSSFMPTFISVLNGEACKFNIGNLYALNRLLDAKTGFICNGRQEFQLDNSDKFLNQIFNSD